MVGRLYDIIKNHVKFTSKYGVYFFWLFIIVSITMFGCFLNHTVMVHNGGRMPVLIDIDVDTPTHFSYNCIQEIEHWYLTDRFNISGSIWSIGDFILLSGLLMFTIVLSLFYIQSKKEGWK